MTASPLPAWEDATAVIDVTPHERQNVPSESVSIVTTKDTFSSYLAPLTKDTFKQVVTGVEEKLRIVNQTLSLLDGQEFETILQEMLQSITLKTGELLGADRTTIFLLDDEKHELWSIVAEAEGERSLEIRLPADQGIAGEVATFKRVVNIPHDFYDDPRSNTAKRQDQRNGYRTYTMLALPLLSEQGDLVAVVQLLNKLKIFLQPWKAL